MDTTTIIFWIKIAFVFYILTILAVIDIARKDFGSMAKKALWACVALVPFIGGLIYLFFGFRKGQKPDLHKL
ncbi:MAG: PLD nuclease N-terminal domain-containing protein [Proteobacteria bacterium]|nr:PLD nuclease N-terminal domain-containing protein [Pseudomonadota bacterium]